MGESYASGFPDLDEEIFRLRARIAQVEGELVLARAVKVCCGNWSECVVPCVPRAEHFRARAEKAEQENARLREAVAFQACDDGLWFEATTAAEAYLQQELRRLHAMIEGDKKALSALPATERDRLRNALQPFTKHNSSEEYITITVRTADVTAARTVLGGE